MDELRTYADRRLELGDMIRACTWRAGPGMIRMTFPPGDEQPGAAARSFFLPDCRDHAERRPTRTPGPGRACPALPDWCRSMRVAGMLYGPGSRIYAQNKVRRRGSPSIAVTANGPCPTRAGGRMPHAGP